MESEISLPHLQKPATCPVVHPSENGQLFSYFTKKFIGNNCLNCRSRKVHIVYTYVHIYRVCQEECARLRESVPYVKVYRYNPKHLYPKLNGYGDNGQRKVGASCGSKYCNLHS